MVDIRKHPEVLKCRIEVRVRELDLLAAETAASTNRVYRRPLPLPLAAEGRLRPRSVLLPSGERRTVLGLAD
jgi:hypothetical protein